MDKKHLLVTILSAIVIIALALGLWYSGSGGINVPGSVVNDGTTVGLGVTYLNVTDSLAEYYNLGVNHGAMVLGVRPGSLAAFAGLKFGDIILSFNGVQTEQDNPLLGMMMNCPAGNPVTLEVWRKDRIDTVSVYN